MEAKQPDSHATVGRLSNNCFPRYQANGIICEKSRWTVTWQWSGITRLSADCQTTFFRRSKQLEIFLKKVAERSPDNSRPVGWLSNNVFWTFQAVWENFEKKSLNGHATVVGVHATVGRLSNNVFCTFQAIRNFFEKSRWTVTRQWSEVTRPSADCQTTFFDVSSNYKSFWKKSLNGHATVVEVTRLSADCQTTIFGRFKQLEIFLKKVAERSRDSGQRSRDRRPTVKQRFLDVSSNFGKILEKVAERSRDSGRRSRDRRLTVKQRFLDVSSNLGKFWKKSLNGHATLVGGHATVGRLSNNVFWTFQAIRKFFEKSRWTVTRQWLRSRDRRPTVKQTFFGRFKRFGKILKKVAERSRDNGWGHATVGRLSNNVFWTFQAIRNFFEKSRWTVTRQWSEVTRPSADCQTTFFRRFKRFGKILKKVAERSRDSGWGHATVGRLSNNVFWTFQAIRKFFEKSRWTVTRQWSEVTRPSADCVTTFFGRFKRFGKILKKVAERSRDSGWGHATVGRLSNKRFLDVSSN